MDAWFNEQMAGFVGGIIGGSMGMMGGLIGVMSGLCVRKGWKKLMYSVFAVCIAFSVGLLVACAVALLSRQPYHVWYVLGLPGLIGTIVFAGVFPVVRKRFIESELRQMQAKDI